MARWSLTDNQAEAILNMRLRALRKLEEFEIRKEFDGLSAEKTQIEALLASDAKQWKTIRWEVRNMRKKFGPDTRARQAPHHLRRRAGARRRRHPPRHDREGAGHRRRLGKGLAARHEGPSHRLVAADLQGGRQPEARLPCADDRQDPGLHHRRQVLHDRRRPAAGRARPWRADPHHRRHGERPGHRHGLRPRPEAQAAARLARGQRLRRAGGGGRRQHPQGQAGDERQAARRGARAACLVAAITSRSSAKTARCWSSRSPRCRRWRAARASGCRNTRMAALLDIKTFDMASGLSWQDSADRTFVQTREELAEWIGARASAGRIAPKGFPRTGKFG